MKFDVLRDSDYHEGREGADVEQPVEGAIFNAEENRWELEVDSLDALLEAIEQAGHPAVLLPACRNCGDLPVLNIIDVEQDDEDEVVGTPALN